MTFLAWLIICVPSAILYATRVEKQEIAIQLLVIFCLLFFGRWLIKTRGCTKTIGFLAVALGLVSYAYFIVQPFVTGKIYSIPRARGATGTEEITSFKSNVTINSNSTVDITEEISYNIPSPRHGILRDIPYRYKDETNNKYFQTPIDNITIANEKDDLIPFSSSKENNYLKLKIGDANKTVEGVQIYKIFYTLSGVINPFENHDELYLNVTGNNWTVPITNVETKITLPANYDKDKLQTKCFTGVTGSKFENCSINTKDNPIVISSSDGPLTAVVGFNKGIVTLSERRYERNWRHESGWFWIIPILVLLYLIYSYLRNGRDPLGRKTIVPEFDIPEKLKPAEMGALIDEDVDNTDISATIVDLAVRGYLKIIQKDKKYSLEKIKEADTKLQTFEKEIFDSLFDGKKTVKLSEVHETFASNLAKVKDDIYDELVMRKYFYKNPDNVRNTYYWKGFILFALAWIFVWLSWHLVSALIATSIIVLIFAHFMPKKTLAGVLAKEKAYGFKEFLYRAERYRLKWQEKEEIFEKYLPYALVFGIADKWAKNFQNIYKNPPSWYEGDFRTFNTVILANSLANFNSSANASYSPPASSGSSGFGEGGSSGGGFGGGGGGSW